MSEQAEQKTLVYIMPGSQFVAKTLTALDAVKVPYQTVQVDPTGLKKLPPPHTVPQIMWRGELITDSSDILKRIDEDCPDAPFKFYPDKHKQAVEELEQFCGTVLHGHALYFTWWVEHGFKETVEKVLAAKYWPVPPFLLFPVLALGGFDIGRLRGSVRKKARGFLGESLIPEGRDAKPDEEENMKQALLGHLRDLDARFSTESQLWLCGTENPSAADFAAYGMVDRLVGHMGDSGFGVPLPGLWEEANVPRLQTWHTRMLERYPIKFRGKSGECKSWAQSDA